MSRYIDADPLYEQIAEKEELARQRVLDTPTHYGGRVNPTYIRYSAQADERTNMRKMVMDAPTIDAEPVRHGKWIDMGDFEQCSVCTATHLKTIQTMYGKARWIKSDYCPACGAYMKGTEKDG